MKPYFNDPERAREFFKAKMEFTTGPVELGHMLDNKNENINIVDVRAAEYYAKCRGGGGISNFLNGISKRGGGGGLKRQAPHG